MSNRDGITRVGDGRLVLPDRREYDHFAVTRGGVMVFDWPEPVPASEAYDHVCDVPDRIARIVPKLAAGASFEMLVRSLGMHLADSKYRLVSQIQINPRSTEMSVFGEVAEGEVVEFGQVREQDVRQAERVARAKRSSRGGPLDRPSAGAMLRRDPLGRKDVN